ncbi:hypothetical protein BO82DRAFT_217089 [Aspergillus uvarum CBS 121591]|uniref:Uncharacterized protein n=1 Tax=Aspergillus uvarum CBS 121591 TaxID=1448315 RepID=A0A319BUF1_9EURO|nr:hypothetical protein BO82DRAFT_217089 [Aspergillus uvarum CBS 121591]PYH76071.1 hypothetical protein BO82DRAFT_217089 [Aspergillus uvarum CBS 121591]
MRTHRLPPTDFSSQLDHLLRKKSYLHTWHTYQPDHTHHLLGTIKFSVYFVPPSPPAHKPTRTWGS